MARKRSRSNTEQRFQDAVLELIADSGFEKIGVNAVASHAGSDKVLIYRYFGGLEGLLQRVAESRTWLPSVEDLCAALPQEPSRILSDLAFQMNSHIRQDEPTYQLSRWRHAVQNPVTRRYTDEWKNLWKALPERLGDGLDYEARQDWTKVCALLALTIQAELAGEAVDRKCLDGFIQQLAAPQAKEAEAFYFKDNDILPTNLL